VETSDAIDVATTVDAKGQSCPMPILMAAKAAKELQPGQVMLIEATDNGSRSDVPAWVAQTGNELVDSQEDDSILRFWVRKN
jgi:tRNA 2-thiouridine synthesizing protein A